MEWVLPLTFPKSTFMTLHLRKSEIIYIIPPPVFLTVERAFVILCVLSSIRKDVGRIGIPRQIKIVSIAESSQNLFGCANNKPVSKTRRVDTVLSWPKILFLM